MDKRGVAVADGEITEQNELGHSLNSIPEDDLSLLLDFDSSLFPELSAPINELSNPSPDSLSFSIDQIEHLLMMDDDNQNDNGCVEQLSAEIPDDFFSDILLDSPADSDQSAEVVNVTDDGKNSNSSSPSSSSSSKEEEEQDEEKDKVSDSGMQENMNANVDDKKLRRQLRNRDAAVRSRERKKSYVKDLEMKSRYLEGECRRLGMLLQCCAAENQALRLSLQNAKAYDASMTKQESAVLLLESLLLGSLLWFLGSVCLFILPKPLPLIREAVPPENVDRKNQGSLAPLRKAESNKVFVIQKSQLFVMSRRCKASRSRMKYSFLRLGISV